MTDVIVVGAGVIGLLTALELAEAGLKVQVIERGQPGREASWAGGGILSTLPPWQYPQAVLALSEWSQAAYPLLCERLRSATGIDPEWTAGGLLVQAPELPAAQNWAIQRAVAMECLDQDQQSRRYPGIAADPSAILLADVAQVRSPRLLQALIAYLGKLGVDLKTNRPVTRLMLHRNKVVGIETPVEQLPAAAVVICAGAWSAGLTPFPLSVEPVKGQMLLYAGVPERLPVMLLRGETYLIPRRDGQVLAGSSVERTGFDKTPSEAVRERLHSEAIRLFPALRDARLECHWAGLRPSSTEGIPYIGCHREWEGLYLNTGHYRHGLLTAPSSARLLADIVLGKTPILNQNDYAPI